MSYSLAIELKEITRTRISQGPIDMTLSLDSRYTGPDRRVIKGTLFYNDDALDSILSIIIAFRSDIMNSFERFDATSRNRFLPCDIPGIIPSIVSLLKLGNKVRCFFTETTDAGCLQLELKFTGTSCLKGSLHDLAVSVHRFMERWSQYTEVLIRTLLKDPVMDTWKMTHDDIRELLLGESGFVTMPWFTYSLNYIDRARIMDRVQDASKALLVSVLTKKQLNEPIVKELVDWLESLTPLPEIKGSQRMTELSGEVV